MPIPALNSEGALPTGVFDCILLEVRTRFGVFSGSDRRVRLFARLEELVLSMQASGLFEEMRRLQTEIEQLTAEITARSPAAA